MMRAFSIMTACGAAATPEVLRLRSWTGYGKMIARYAAADGRGHFTDGSAPISPVSDAAPSPTAVAVLPPEVTAAPASGPRVVTTLRRLVSLAPYLGVLRPLASPSSLF